MTTISEADRLVAWGDLREFLRLSRQRQELQVVRGADPYLATPFLDSSRDQR